MNICLEIELANSFNIEAWKFYLRCLDMIMEVVTEGLDMGDVLVAALWCEMAREKNYRASVVEQNTRDQTECLTKCDITDFTISSILKTWNSCQFQREIVPEEHLGCVLQSHYPSSRIDEFLQ